MFSAQSINTTKMVLDSAMVVLHFFLIKPLTSPSLARATPTKPAPQTANGSEFCHVSNFDQTRRASRAQTFKSRIASVSHDGGLLECTAGNATQTGRII